MKIYITKFIWDGQEHAGPNIHAENFDNAELIAESQGLEVLGELQDIIQAFDIEQGSKVLH
tara:strand:+ start:3703 stop:3885 length:183 start_codon:yes stop_codon:yes gene_type:complete